VKTRVKDDQVAFYMRLFLKNVILGHY